MYTKPVEIFTYRINVLSEKLILPPSPSQVRQSAIQLLARREHSRVELHQKLQQRGYPKELIEEQLTKLVNQGLLSDQRFAENYIRSRSNKGYGPVRIINELQQRGVVEEIIATFMNEITKDWFQLAEQVRQKRFGKKIPADFAEKAKQIRFLQYRGFDMAQITKIMAR